MKFSIEEVKVIIESVISRKSWIEDDLDAPQEDLFFLESSLDKLTMFEIEFEKGGGE